MGKKQTNKLTTIYNQADEARAKEASSACDRPSQIRLWRQQVAVRKDKHKHTSVGVHPRLNLASNRTLWSYRDRVIRVIIIIIILIMIRNDIALLKVNRDFDCVERRLYPACLPTRWHFQKYNKIQKQGLTRWKFFWTTYTKPALLNSTYCRGETYAGWKRVISYQAPSKNFKTHFYCEAMVKRPFKNGQIVVES